MPVAADKTIRLLGCPMQALSMQETITIIDHQLQQGNFVQHVVVNVAKLVNMQKDQELRRSIECCDIINIDGMGVVLGARFLGHQIPERVAGIDLFMELISLSSKRDYPIYLLGARQEVVEEVSVRLSLRHHKLNIAGYHHGYFGNNEKEIVTRIRASGAKLLFVAISSPMKEIFINKWKNELGVDFVMGVGGTFDVVAGKVKRAPTWMQTYGLEWLFRVLQEPRRMWRRYLFTNLIFAKLVLKEKLARIINK